MTAEPVPFDLRSAREAFATAGRLHGEATRLRRGQAAPGATSTACAPPTPSYTPALAEARVEDAIAADDAFHQVLLDAADDPDLQVSRRPAAAAAAAGWTSGLRAQDARARRGEHAPRDHRRPGGGRRRGRGAAGREQLRRRPARRSTAGERTLGCRRAQPPPEAGDRRAGAPPPRRRRRSSPRSSGSCATTPRSLVAAARAAEPLAARRAAGGHGPRARRAVALGRPRPLGRSSGNAPRCPGRGRCRIGAARPSILANGRIRRPTDDPRRHAMQYMLLIYRPGRGHARPRTWPAESPTLVRLQERLAAAGLMVAGDGPAGPEHRHDRPRPRRRDAGHRRPVRRDQGAARRLLPHRRARSATAQAWAAQMPEHRLRLGRGAADHGDPGRGARSHEVHAAALRPAEVRERRATPARRWRRGRLHARAAGGRRRRVGDNALQGLDTATTVRDARRRDARHRRAVRRDQGDARRLLPDRRARPRRGAGVGRARSPTRRTAASRCARSWSSSA